MATSDFKSVDDYITSQPETVQRVLARVRRTIRKAVPAAIEGIRYKMPAYKLHGLPMLYFAAWRQHYSLYPATTHLIATFRDDLAPYDVNKNTIRLPLAGAVPVKLIGRIAKFRAKEVTDRKRVSRKVSQ
jgi:uncharacterized protein YdhG (YjbR/CyaY superfamily)